MSMQQVDVQNAKQQLVVVVEESQLSDMLEQIEKLELENTKLKQNLEGREESESKVFSYLNSKVLDSNEQLNEVERNFIEQRRKLEHTTRDVKAQSLALEDKKNRELQTVNDENQALRDNIALFEQYEIEIPVLDEKVAQLEDILKKMCEKHEEAMINASARNESAKRNAHTLAMAEVEVIAQKTLEECDAHLDLKTKLCLEENDIIEQELKHQVSGSEDLETRVKSIESVNKELKLKLKEAQASEVAVSKLMHLKQREYKEVKLRLDELSLSQQETHQKMMSMSNFSAQGSKQQHKNKLKFENMIKKIAKKSPDKVKLMDNHSVSSQASSTSSYMAPLQFSSYHHSTSNPDVGHGGDDDLNIILRKQLKEKLEEKAKIDKKEKDSLLKVLKKTRGENQDIYLKIDELSSNLDRLLQLQQEDIVVTSTLEVTEDLNQSFKLHYSSPSTNSKSSHFTTANSSSFDDSKKTMDEIQKDSKYFQHQIHRSTTPDFQVITFENYKKDEVLDDEGVRASSLQWSDASPTVLPTSSPKSTSPLSGGLVREHISDNEALSPSFTVVSHQEKLAELWRKEAYVPSNMSRQLKKKDNDDCFDRFLQDGYLQSNHSLGSSSGRISDRIRNGGGGGIPQSFANEQGDEMRQYYRKGGELNQTNEFVDKKMNNFLNLILSHVQASKYREDYLESLRSKVTKNRHSELPSVW